MIKFPATGCALLVLIGCRAPSGSLAHAPPVHRPTLPVVRLEIGGRTAYAELAQTPETRALGLMFRQSLAPDSGMLFLFDNDDTYRFWMKNTFIPLSIAFIDRNGAITDILEMTPRDTTSRYRPSRPIRYALEMNSGWFRLQGINPGDTVSGLPAQ